MTPNTNAIADACQIHWEDGGEPVPDYRGRDLETVLVPEAVYSGRRSLQARKSIAGGRISLRAPDGARRL